LLGIVRGKEDESMKKILVVANWKMNPQNLAEAKKLFSSVVKGVRGIKKAEIVICPPFVYLPILTLIEKTSRTSLKLGAQDCFWKEKGAFTGEVSPMMLKDLGYQYVIVGHSERRKYLKETDEMINKKIKAALKVGLKPILCIDETSQIPKNIENLIIAYEPLFAIGTGKPCSLEQAKKIRSKIKHSIVLYGGSVNSKNAVNYIKQAGFQGLLIGSASLRTKEFIKIVRSVALISKNC